jgi:hypothetical protein
VQEKLIKTCNSVKRRIYLKYRRNLPLLHFGISHWLCMNQRFGHGIAAINRFNRGEKTWLKKTAFRLITFTEGPIRTDEPSKSLLGSFYDPVFSE